MSDEGSTGNRSISTTPKSSVSGTPSKKRRIDAVDELLTYANRNPHGVVTTQDIQRVALESGILSSESRSLTGIVTIQASALRDMAFTIEILQIDWIADEQHVWSFPAGPSAVMLSRDAEDLSFRMRTATWWKWQSCEAMSRTLVDIVLFDILSQNSEALISKDMRLVGEQRVVTTRPTGGFISGTADYVLGFRTQVSSESYHYRGISVIIEAKKYANIESAMSQAIAYMLGCQQKRVDTEPDLYSDATYGIISDGLTWQFLKLEGRKLTISEGLRMMTLEHRRQVYGFVDFIVKSAIAMSPPNSPAVQRSAEQGPPPPESPTPVRSSEPSVLDVFNA